LEILLHDEIRRCETTLEHPARRARYGDVAEVAAVIALVGMIQAKRSGEPLNWNMIMTCPQKTLPVEAGVLS
jgi:hypothetical protein